MLDLEDRINRVFNPDVRPLVREAYRCYTSGAARGAIVLAWTAVCADLITKAQILKEEGEAAAGELVSSVERAQRSSEPESIQVMLGVEKTILDTAEKLELIDFTQKMQLERLRDDRNLCAHPSLRPLGELYEPTMEYARAHLAVALETVLIHRPSQGRKIVDSFSAHVLDPGFAFDTDYLARAFFDRVRPSARIKVVEFAAKFAVLEIDPEQGVDSVELADRMGRCLRCFAERDADLAKQAIAKTMQRLEQATPAVQMRALGRLGDLPAFGAAIAEPTRAHFNTRIEQIGNPARTGRLKPADARAITLVALPELRTWLPALEDTFTSLAVHERAEVIALRPDRYFAPYLPSLLSEARSFDEGELIARTAVLPCAVHLTLDQLETVLREWQDNPQCWGRAMPGYLVKLYHETAHLGEARNAVWRSFLEELAEYADIHKRISDGIGF